MNRCCFLIPLFVIAILGGCSQGPNGGTAATARPTKGSEVVGEKIAVKQDVPPKMNSVPPLEIPREDGINHLSPAEVAEGWIKLFDGETLFGWKSNNQLGWSVQEGVITADRRDAADEGLLVTTTRFANYELRADYRLEKGGNSGLFLRTPVTPTNPAVDCYELNMCDSKPNFATASLVGRANPVKTVLGDGDWHTYHVRVEGDRIVVQFDGEQVLEYTDQEPVPLKTGHIGLQMKGGKIEFRNLFLKPLGAQPLFDGQTLNGWHDVPGSQSQFTVKEEAIQVLNGRGFLETEMTAGNFVLQFDAITHGDKLNSGIFFRAMKGTEETPSHGYEFQIHNGIKEGDRNRPEDHGTGAIFRRVSARRVVSNDREWLSGTLIADGAHFSTWVNGIQVVDWTDERPANDNPREGLRLAPGHLSLQGHDPTTDLAFRRLRLAETPE